MVGYAPSAAAFFIFVAVFCMFQLTSETIGTMCAIACGNATYAILVRPLPRLPPRAPLHRWSPACRMPRFPSHGAALSSASFGSRPAPASLGPPDAPCR